MSKYVLISVAILLSTIAATPFAGENTHTDAKYKELIDELCSHDAAPVKTTSRNNIFSWTDADGNIHFGDRPPQNANAEQQKTQGRKDYFDMKVSFPSGEIGNGIDNALLINGRAIATAISQLLPSGAMSKSDIDMKVFASKKDFRNYMLQETESYSDNVAGFYLPLGNKVAVLYSRNDVHVQKVALHESTHVFQYQSIGYMPSWITEGMAEYFEYLEVRGNAKEVSVNQGWLQYIRSNPSISAKTLMTSAHRNWKGQHASLFYGNSWALFYFMMLPENRNIMKTLIADMAKDKCDEVPDEYYVNIVNENYRGGIAQLEKDWRSWINSDHQIPNYH